MLQNLDALLGSILKAKYFLNSQLFECIDGSQPIICLEKSSLGSKFTEKWFLIWGIGSGFSIRGFKDPWFLKPFTFKPITIPATQFANLSVGELRTETCQWNWNIINEIFWPIDHEEFRKFPIHALPSGLWEMG